MFGHRRSEWTMESRQSSPNAPFPVGPPARARPCCRRCAQPGLASAGPLGKWWVGSVENTSIAPLLGPRSPTRAGTGSGSWLTWLCMCAGVGTDRAERVIVACHGATIADTIPNDMPQQGCLLMGLTVFSDAMQGVLDVGVIEDSAGLSNDSNHACDGGRALQAWKHVAWVIICTVEGAHESDTLTVECDISLSDRATRRFGVTPRFILAMAPGSVWDALQWPPKIASASIWHYQARVTMARTQSMSQVEVTVREKRSECKATETDTQLIGVG